MYTDKKDLKIGDVCLMMFDGTESEQRGWRPGLVIQNNVGNANSPNIIAFPLTSAIKNTRMPTHVVVKSSDTGLKVDSMVLCENPQRMSKKNIGKFITSLPKEYMRLVAIGDILSKSLISFIEPQELLGLWEKAAKLNAT